MDEEGPDVDDQIRQEETVTEVHFAEPIGTLCFLSLPQYVRCMYIHGGTAIYLYTCRVRKGGSFRNGD